MSNMRTRDVVRVAESVPVDRVARRLLAPGVHFVGDYKPKCVTQQTPHKLIPWKGPPEENHTGKRCGRLRVMGYVGHVKGRGDKGKGGARWSVRCDCGNYEVRSAKAIKGPMAHVERCNACAYMRFLQRRAYFDKHGRWPTDEWQP